MAWMRREGGEAQREKLVGGHGGTESLLMAVKYTCPPHAEHSVWGWVSHGPCLPGASSPAVLSAVTCL